MKQKHLSLGRVKFTLSREKISSIMQQHGQHPRHSYIAFIQYALVLLNSQKQKETFIFFYLARHGNLSRSDVWCFR